MPSNVRQLLENGTPIYPITERSLVIGLQDAPFEYYVLAWDGASTPVVSKIPAGVVVTYNNTNYTGTLAASATTAPYLYLVASTTQAGEYDRYIVTNNGNNTFSWTPVGSTAPVTPVIVDDLVTNDATKALSAKQGKVLKDELSQFEAKVTDLEDTVNGGIVEQTIQRETTAQGYRVTHGGKSTDNTATTSAIDSFPVIAGKTYHLTIPSVRSYTSAYCFFTSAVTTTGKTCTQPSPAVVGPATNASYDIVIPEGFSYLIVSYEFADGAPVLTTMVESEGLVDKVINLENDYTALGSSVSSIEENVETISDNVLALETSVEGEETTRTLTHFQRQEGYRITHAPAVTNDNLASVSAICTYPVSPGKSYHLVVPKTNNSYNSVYVFGTSGEITTAATVSPASPAALGDNGTFDGDILIPENVSYLWVAFVFEEGNPTLTITEISGGLINEVSELSDRVDELENEDTIAVYLPNKLYAVVGDTLQLFFHGIVGVVNIADYDIYAECSKGKTFPRYFSYTPVVEDVGTTTLTIYVRDRKGTILGQASCDLVTVSAPSSPLSAKSIFTFGDSLTSGGQWPGEAKRRLAGNSTYDSITGKGLSNLAFYGYMNKTINGQSVDYFGVGGWTWANYLSKGVGGAFRFNVSGVSSLSIGAVYTNNGHSYTVQEINITGDSGNIRCTTSANTNTPSASGTLTKNSGDGDATITFASYETENANPLWDDANNKMSFIPYVQDCGASTIDAVYVLLSWNGQGSWKEYSVNDTTGHIANAKTFARTLHTEYPNAKLFIMGLQMPSDTGGLGYNYGASGGLIDGQGVKQTALNYNKALQDLCNLDEFSPYCEFVAVAPQFDSHYNMPYSEVKVNIRNSVTEMLGRNGVHPSDAGYFQIADAVYRSIVANFCQ